MPACCKLIITLTTGIYCTYYQSYSCFTYCSYKSHSNPTCKLLSRCITFEVSLSNNTSTTRTRSSSSKLAQQSLLPPILSVSMQPGKAWINLCHRIACKHLRGTLLPSVLYELSLQLSLYTQVPTSSYPFWSYLIICTGTGQSATQLWYSYLFDHGWQA